MTYLTVQWKGKKLPIDFSKEAMNYGIDNWTSVVTLNALLIRCSAASGVPVEFIKLLKSGDPYYSNDNVSKNWWENIVDFWNDTINDLTDATTQTGSFVMMKDPNLTLARYGITEGSKIVMLGDKPENYRVPGTSSTSYQDTQLNQTREVPEPQQQPAYVDPEISLIQKLEAILNSVRQTTVPLIESYSTLVSNVVSQHDSGVEELSTTPKNLKDSHSKCSELLMQSLLKIDGVAAGEFERARTKRKEAVKTIQMLMDRVDGLKSKVDEVLKERNLL
ncbi:hypothetical protein HK098_000759 [Nowakowskiella sp. JEL0407]|nr:hypothetical protein HK098_000759 [Nowakowskiella sp. JEL0407]